MDYNRPDLGERLAADYVLGLMPPRARQRFERELAANATLSATVAGWSERFAPLDDTTRDEAPPPHIWRAIDRRIGANAAAPAQRRSLSVFWRGVVLTAAAACATAIIYIAPNPAALHRDLLALADRAGISDWVGSAPRAMPDIGLSTMRLGVPERERPRWLRAALLLSSEARPLTVPQAPPPR